jgi:hypothetical protein
LVFKDDLTNEDILNMSFLLQNLLKTANTTFDEDRIRLPTFHTLLHIPDEITELGSPVNSMAGRFEYLLIFLIKFII